MSHNLVTSSGAQLSQTACFLCSMLDFKMNVVIFKNNNPSQETLFSYISQFIQLGWQDLIIFLKLNSCKKKNSEKH